jgi:membrane-associated phospholipid phosphatase
MTWHAEDPDIAAAAAPKIGWREIARLFTRPQPVPPAFVALALVAPFYLFIGGTFKTRTLHVPAIDLDRALPVEPAWAPIYLSLFLAALLPVFVLHQQDLIRRTVNAYLAAWLASFAVFFAYPTVATIPASVPGDGFLDWMLRTIYSSDVRYNCFPSLHVAQSFLAAFACWRVHRGVGGVAFVWATLVGISTLYTKQHYVLDVISGALLAAVMDWIFMRGYPREATPQFERRAAPILAAGAFATYGVFVLVMWVAYLNGVVI